MADLFNLSGIIDIDISKALRAMDNMMNAAERAAGSLLRFFGVGSSATQMNTDFTKIGATMLGVAASFDLMANSFTKGFGEISKAGGDAFDYVGSRAEDMTRKAIIARSEFEKFQKSVDIFLKSPEKSKQVTQSAMDNIASSGTFLAPEILTAYQKLSKKTQDPSKIDEYVKLAEEMSVASGQALEVSTKTILRLLSRSPEAFRGLKNNLGIGVEDLQKQGVSFDSRDRLRLRNQGDVDAAVQGVQKYMQSLTDMKLVQEQANTVAGKWASLQNKAFTTLASYAEAVTPTVKAWIDAVKDIIDWFSKLDPSTKNIIAQFVLYTSAAFALSTALAPIAAILTTLASGFVNIGIAVTAAVAAWKLWTGLTSSYGGITGLTENVLSKLTIKKVAATQGVEEVESLVAQGLASGALKKTSTAIRGVGRNAVFFEEGLAATGAEGAAILARKAEAEALATATAKAEKVVAKSLFTFDGWMTKLGGLFNYVGNALKTLGVGLAAITILMGADVIINSWNNYYKKVGDDIDKVTQKIKDQALSKQALALAGKSQSEQDEFYKKHPGMKTLYANALENVGNQTNPDYDWSVGYEDAKKSGNLKMVSHTAHSSGGQFGGGDVSFTSEETKQEYAARMKAESDQTAAKKAKEAFDAQKAHEQEVIDMTEKIKSDQAEAMEKYKLGILDSTDIWRAQQDIVSRAMKAHMSDEDILKLKVQERAALMTKIAEDEYKNITRIENMHKAMGVYNNEEGIRDANERINDWNKNFITKDRFNDNAANVLKTSGPLSNDELDKRAAGGKLVATEQDAKQQDKNYEELYAGLAKRTKEQAEVQIQAYKNTNDNFKASLAEAAEKHREAMLTMSGSEKVNVDQRIAEQARYAKEVAKINLENDNKWSAIKAIGLKADGQEFQANLIQLANSHKMAMFEMQGQSAQNTAARIAEEAKFNAEVKKEYIKDFLSWKEVQKQKEDFEDKMKLNKMERNLSSLQFNEKMTGKDNTQAQIAQYKQITDFKIKQAQDDAEKEREILEKKLTQFSSSGKNNVVDINGKSAYDPAFSASATRHVVSQEEQKDKNQLAQINKKLKDSVEALKKAEDEFTAEKLRQAKIRKDEIAEKGTDIALHTEEFRENVLLKKMGKATTPDQVDQLEKKAQDSIKKQYDFAAKDLNQLEKIAIEKSGGEGSDEAQNIHKQFALERNELQEKYLDKMKDTTEEMEKQKSLLESQKKDFTLGGIYNSYDAIMKATAENEGTSPDPEAGDSTFAGDDKNRMNSAALKLGIDPNLNKNIVYGVGKNLGIGLGSIDPITGVRGSVNPYADGYPKIRADHPRSNYGDDIKGLTSAISDANINVYLNGEKVASQSRFNNLSSKLNTNNAPVGGSDGARA